MAKALGGKYDRRTTIVADAATRHEGALISDHRQKEAWKGSFIFFGEITALPEDPLATEQTVRGALTLCSLTKYKQSHW